MAFWGRCCTAVSPCSAEAVDTEEPGTKNNPTTLLEAATLGHLALVDAFLKSGSDPNLTTGEEDREAVHATALILASRHGHTAVVERLLLEPQLDLAAASGNLDIPPRNKQTAMHWAARQGHLAVLGALVKDPRTDLEAETQLKFTPIFLAAQGGHTSCLSALITAGADAKKKVPVPGTMLTPLSIAMYEHRLDCIHILATKGGYDLNEPLPFTLGDNTCLGAAAKNNWVDIIKVLLQARANPDVAADGQTPFDIAYSNDAVEIVMNLVTYGCTTSHAMSPVSYACLLGDSARLVKLVTNKQPLPAEQLQKQNTLTGSSWSISQALHHKSKAIGVPALHHATLLNSAKKVKEILRELEDPRCARYIKDSGGMPAVFHAIELGRVEVARILLTQAHDFSDALFETIVKCIVPRKSTQYTRGQNTFDVIMTLFRTTAVEDHKYSKGVAAFLMPWMGSLTAFQFLRERHNDFHTLRGLCEERSAAIYDRIDAEVTAPVLRHLGKIGEAFVDMTCRQDEQGLLPKLEYYIDEKKKQVIGGDREKFFAMDLALVGIAVDDLFQADIASLLGGLAKKVHTAPPKTFARMCNKLLNLHDHGDISIPKPRTAKNTDVIRCGVEMHRWEDVEALFDLLKSKYRILRVKNTHDPDHSGFGGYRSILVNFAYEPNVTFESIFGTGSFDVDKGLEEGWSLPDERSETWFEYVSALPQKGDWRWSLLALWYIARTQPGSPIVLSAEVQIILSPYMVGRSLSHLLFKISRCETGPDEMVRDFASPLHEKQPTDDVVGIARRVREGVSSGQP